MNIKKPRSPCSRTAVDNLSKKKKEEKRKTGINHRQGLTTFYKKKGGKMGRFFETRKNLISQPFIHITVSSCFFFLESSCDRKSRVKLERERSQSIFRVSSIHKPLII